MEKFIDIKGYEGLYKISEKAEIKSLSKKVGSGYFSKEIILKKSLDRYGYLYVGLSKKGVVKKHKIHRLIAINFILNPENKLMINHKNGIKTDNSILNLEWCTPKENCIHAYSLGLQKPIKGIFNKRSIPVIQYDMENNFINKFHGLREAMRKTGCAVGDISACCKGRKKHVKLYIWKYDI